MGSEVKSLREKRGNINGAFGRIENGECFLYNSHIDQYPQGISYDEKRKRKLLLHKYQIKRLEGKLQEKRMVLVPIRLYFKNGKVKVELGIGRGKRLVDKREEIKKKEINREIQRTLKSIKSNFSLP